jgi:hypothetical protein
MKASRGTSNLIVVIPTYQRSEKLEARVEEILRWNRLKHLVLSIDPARKSSNADELHRTQLVSKTARKLASKDSRIQLLEWRDNQGINVHYARMFEEFKDESSIIIVEEDVSVNAMALDFLADNSRKDGSLAASAFVASRHSSLKPNASFQTLFPMQWGISVSAEVMEHYIFILKTGSFSKKLIKKVFKSQLGDVLSVWELEKLTQWWFNHFFFCRNHGNWADALIQYSVYANLGFYRAPASPLAQDDVTDFDPLSLTPRTAMNHQVECKAFDYHVLGDQFYCVSCQIQHSHLHEIGAFKLLASTRYRRFSPELHTSINW